MIGRTDNDESVTRPDQPVWNPQRGGAMPHRRYRPALSESAAELPDRRWPSRRLTSAPLWVPVDLRDGNQALPEPMDVERKLRMFRMLVHMGFKEIEAGYPSASSHDHQFVRLLAEAESPPDDITIVLFTPARDDLIERTVDAALGLARVVIHLCVPTAPRWRRTVLGHDRRSLLRHIVDSALHVQECAADLKNSEVRFQFSPEAFNVTERDYALDVCDAVTETWDARRDRPVTINLPTTVEVTGPNIFADQVEWMDRNLSRRDAVILSIHPHNDRGTAVASAELGLLAGAQRVEGCLFGNGERTGNVDLVTLAMNLFSQGVDPQLDLSDIDEVQRVVESCTRIPLPERHPYAGRLVFTAFSGTHQDAIRKGLVEHEAYASTHGIAAREAPWEVPYLPVDPADLGRSYDAVIRVNSQSGKSGVAHLLEKDSGLRPPRGLLQEFAAGVQVASEQSAHGAELPPGALGALFRAEYLGGRDRTEMSQVSCSVAGGVHSVKATASVGTASRSLQGKGPSPVHAVADAFHREGLCEKLLEHQVHEMGADARTAVYVRVQRHGMPHWGAGVSDYAVQAAVVAFLSALERCDRSCSGGTTSRPDGTDQTG